METSPVEQSKLIDEIQRNFGTAIDVQQLVLNSVPVSRSVNASLILTSKKQLFLYVVGESKLLLSDVKKIVTRMGLTAELYMPPKGQPDYFNEVGRRKYAEIFPGMKNINDNDLIYYRTLAPYNPALVLISEVKNGFVYQYDPHAASEWRPSVKFAYRRILTS